MPGAALQENGLTQWTDNVDNWRSADADYLQKRSVMRFTSLASRNAIITNPAPGMVSYVNGQLYLADATTQTAPTDWKTVLAPRALTVTDTNTSLGMRLTGDGTNVLALEAGRVALGPGRALIVDNTGLTVKTGAATAVLTTDATALVSDKQIKAPSLAITAAINAASLTATGSITGASVQATGSMSAGTLSVSGAAVINTLTASVLTVNGNASATGQLTGNVVVGTAGTYGGQLVMYSNLVSNPVGGNGASMQLTANAFLNGGVVVLNSTGGPARYGHTGGPIIACVVASAGDPGAGNYPEGTIWAQV